MVHNVQRREEWFFPRNKTELRGDSPSFEVVTAIVSRAFLDGALSCAISERASPPAVSFRRHLPVKLSHWHRPTDFVGRLLVCPPFARRTQYAHGAVFLI